MGLKTRIWVEYCPSNYAAPSVSLESVFEEVPSDNPRIWREQLYLRLESELLCWNPGVIRKSSHWREICSLHGSWKPGRRLISVRLEIGDLLPGKISPPRNKDLQEQFLTREAVNLTENINSPYFDYLWKLHFCNLWIQTTNHHRIIVLSYCTTYCVYLKIEFTVIISQL